MKISDKKKKAICNDVIWFLENNIPLLIKEEETVAIERTIAIKRRNKKPFDVTIKINSEEWELAEDPRKAVKL